MTMQDRTDDKPEGGHALIDSHVEGAPPTGDPTILRSSLSIADKTRGDRVGSGPEEYEHGPLSYDRIQHYRFGPELIEHGVRFRLYAPSADKAELLLVDRAPLAMAGDADGWYRIDVAGVGPGTLYRFRVKGFDVPDPASRGQSDDTGGWSVVRGSLGPASERAARPWHEAVIAELHIGTATPEGTFEGLARRIGHFADAGYTAIELMPIGDFPGCHNWGYDGVLPFAPERSYGTPEELRALVDAAHAHGLAVILDVVYNHFGPVDNYLPIYAERFFDNNVQTPWGAGLNFADPLVRLFFLENVRMWLEDYDMDGLRFDAVHEFATSGADLMKRELAAMGRAIKPNAMLILENLDNGATWLERDEAGRPRHFDAQWNDDIHHVLHVIATEQRSGYYRDFADATVEKARRVLAEGFAYQGEPVPRRGDVERGEPSGHLPPSAFVSFIQNHDQIGNQPDGRRLAEDLDAERLDFLHFVIMLSPQIPMFFMGEEAHIRVPFPFFGDLNGEFSKEIREGRAQQAMEFYESQHADELVPDPVAVETMAMAKLDWHEFEATERSQALERFRELGRLRRAHLWSLTETPYEGAEAHQDGRVIAVSWNYGGGTLVMVMNAAPEEGSIDVAPFEPIATTGTQRREGGRMVLGPWSAVISVLPAKG
ncbi:malto-oligosyltrehalose trehalohydrolase [Mesorhizobium sp. BR1-1-16]|uniref:malto-oligosyltrehalose trehalohydrolase n=1 Tax=Mesorhizobium sp. BR1-1-16 TaxID=2876653 RepID=UPI001CCA8EE5|nr:malto-oligosyltrehalose trehalohydrolase [Mesorhizobium sp. BR1-1-16]MBZ9938730.1 malto-oligosyltrehalose trehalohydrolase [Mesorhizobium sp. BR1-1-16]